jgi:hypothetical protein
VGTVTEQFYQGGEWFTAEDRPPEQLSDWAQEGIRRHDEARKRAQAYMADPAHAEEVALIRDMLNGNPLYYEPGIDYDEEPGATWEPVDLGPFLRGEKARPEPTIGLARTDGLRLLYPGKEHTVIGEMESGKSWFCMACAAAELEAGQHVVYIHFEEADPGDTVERVRALGIVDPVILERFHFVGPNEPVVPDKRDALIAYGPSLVVLDGVNEAMSLHTMGIRDEDGVATFRRRLVKPFTAAGASVLGADHVVKDQEKRGRSPLGSIHKGNGLTGSLILLENADPFGRGERGRSHVFITKDRPGYLRRHGKPAGKVAGKTFMGELVVDDVDSWRKADGRPELKFWAPKEPTDDEAAQADGPGDAEVVIQAIEEVTKKGLEANLRNVRGACKGISNARIDETLTDLVIDGRVIEKTGKRNARVFTTVPEDQQFRSPGGVP